jgi:hypothetical protein
MPKLNCKNVRLDNLNIIDFIYRLDLLEGRRLSKAQETILKATYGLPLDQVELEIYRRATGRETYVPLEHDELTLIAGRQSGKTSHIGALIALYEAYRNHGLRRRQRAYILVIAPVIQQADIAFDFISRYIVESPILRQSLVKINSREIELANGVIIACRPCSYSTVRGVPVICAICDEMAFWQHEQTAANPEQEVIDAIRPAMVTVSNTKMIKISTPFRKEGILWNEFRKRNELRYLVWQLSTEEMNPKASKHYLENARCENEQTFRREYLAEFTDNALGWITPEILEPCIVRGHRELPPVSNGTYAAAIDPAFRSSDFGFAVLHRSDVGHMTLAYVTRWTGTKTNPVNFEPVCEQIHEVLKRYGLNVLYGDQHSIDVLKQQFVKLGIQYQERTFGAHTRASIYGNLRQLMTQQKIEIVDEPELLHQLRILEEFKTPNGSVDIRPPGSNHDDMAICVALAASELSKMDMEPRATITLGYVDYGIYWNPSNCPNSALCANCLDCMDASRCLGFKDERRPIIVKKIKSTCLYC